MYPHERSLVTQYEDAPFAIVGINSDETLEKLQGLLHMLLSGSNAHRKSFDLVHRLVSQKGMIPPAMLRSMLPFIEDLMDR